MCFVDQDHSLVLLAKNRLHHQGKPLWRLTFRQFDKIS
jgi:hypothetical protein